MYDLFEHMMILECLKLETLSEFQDVSSESHLIVLFILSS